MEAYGPGRGASNLREDPDLLRGVLASETGNAVYPDNYCLHCQREGVDQSETCFHRHWRVADQAPVAEHRGDAVG